MAVGRELSDQKSRAAFSQVIMAMSLRNRQAHGLVHPPPPHSWTTVMVSCFYLPHLQPTPHIEGATTHLEPHSSCIFPLLKIVHSEWNLNTHVYETPHPSLGYFLTVPFPHSAVAMSATCCSSESQALSPLRTLPSLSLTCSSLRHPCAISLISLSTFLRTFI